MPNITVSLTVSNANEILEAIEKVEKNINELKYNLGRIPALKVEAIEKPSAGTDSSND